MMLNAFVGVNHGFTHKKASYIIEFFGMPFKTKDYFFKKAKSENFLARSVYKLEELDKKFGLLSKDSHVLDLGYYPGSWVQYILAKIGPQGQVVGVDKRPASKALLSDRRLNLFQKDFFDISQLADIGREKPFDVVLSDMAPQTTGVKALDQIKSAEIVDGILDKLEILLTHGGTLVAKIFDGPQTPQIKKKFKENFKEVKNFRPRSTRKVSKEFYIIGKKFLG